MTVDTVYIVVISVVLLATTVWGWFRGMHFGLLTLIGTIFSAAVVNLWQRPLVEFVEQYLSDNLYAWVAVSLSFLLMVLIVGYGSYLLIPKTTEVPDLDARIKLMGALVGLLNGALVVGYVLRYATTLLNDTETSVFLTTFPLTSILHDWLPWYLLSIAGLVSLTNVIRWLKLFIQRLRRPAAKSPEEKESEVLSKINAKLPDS